MGRCTLALSASGALFLGCSGDDGTPPRCPSLVGAALTFGTADESFLALGDEDELAIARIHGSTEEADRTCTATLIRRGWLLTAAHCLRINPLVISRGPAEPGVEVEEAIPHPELDAALLRIAADSLAPAHPMALNALAPDINWVGERMELAGYGLTELGAVAELRFVVETISDVDEITIGVDGGGRSGACLGDSGGPLLMRDRAGRPAVAGVLSRGSASCRNHDTYLRVDRIRDWVNGIAGGDASEPVACGRIEESGGCWFGNALACGTDGLEVSVCEPNTTCGWDPTQARFVCVEPSVDTCQGAGSAGRCFGELARRCDAGRVSDLNCGTCQPCRYSPASGQPECPPL
jgi:hypothetical protein